MRLRLQATRAQQPFTEPNLPGVVGSTENCVGIFTSQTEHLCCFVEVADVKLMTALTRNCRQRAILVHVVPEPKLILGKLPLTRRLLQRTDKCVNRHTVSSTSMNSSTSAS